MARIQIDFEQVMRFGDLHGDVGRALDRHRAAFRNDWGRLDQIIAQYGLTHSTGGETFHGMSLASAMGDADARAGRIAHTLATTSSRIFQYASASQVVDDHFDVGGLGRSVWGPMTGPFGMFLTAMTGGAVADVAAVSIKFVGHAPGLGLLLPVFAGVTGVLDIIDASFGLADPFVDGISKIGYALTAISGVISGAVGVAGVAIAITAGVGSLAAFAAFAAPALLVATVVGFGGLIIVNRHEAAEGLTAVGGLVGRAAGSVAHTASERAHDILETATDVWNDVVVVTRRVENQVRDRALAGAEALHDALTGVNSGLTIPLLLLPTVGTLGAGAAVPIVGATLLNTLMHMTSPGSPSTAPHANPSSVAQPPDPVVTPHPSGADPGRVGATSGVLQPPSGGLQGYLDAAGFYARVAEYTEGPPANGLSDRWNMAAMNCTSWAAYRRTMLDLPPPTGNGWQMGTVSGASPTLGALVSYGSGTREDFGHVMVIEEIISPTQFRVSELNYDGAGGFSDKRIWTTTDGAVWTSTTPDGKTNRAPYATKELRFTT